MDATRRLKIGWLIAGVVILSFLVIVEVERYNDARAISYQKATGLGAVAPHRGVTQYLGFTREREESRAPAASPVADRGGVIGGVPGGVSGVMGGTVSSQPLAAANSPARISASLVPAAEAATTFENKVIRNAVLDLLVKDVRETVAGIQRTTESLGGSVERADVREDGELRIGEMVVRVPSQKLDAALDAFRKAGVRVRSEHQDANDVTRTFVDTEARLRNMRAEEEQYLALLKRSGSMKDTLAVTEKISEVRSEIEQTQAALNLMSHQVSMSAITLTLGEESRAPAVARWRPLYNARLAAKEMLEGLADWVDWLVAIVIKLPLILVWLATLGFFGAIAWKALRAGWRRVRPAVAVGRAET